MHVDCELIIGGAGRGERGAGGGLPRGPVAAQAVEPPRAAVATPGPLCALVPGPPVPHSRRHQLRNFLAPRAARAGRRPHPSKARKEAQSEARDKRAGASELEPCCFYSAGQFVVPPTLPQPPLLLPLPLPLRLLFVTFKCPELNQQAWTLKYSFLKWVPCACFPPAPPSSMLGRVGSDFLFWTPVGKSTKQH